MCTVVVGRARPRAVRSSVRSSRDEAAVSRPLRAVLPGGPRPMRMGTHAERWVVSSALPAQRWLEVPGAAVAPGVLGRRLSGDPSEDSWRKRATGRAPSHRWHCPSPPGRASGSRGVFAPAPSPCPLACPCLAPPCVPRPDRHRHPRRCRRPPFGTRPSFSCPLCPWPSATLRPSLSPPLILCPPSCPLRSQSLPRPRRQYRRSPGRSAAFAHRHLPGTVPPRSKACRGRTGPLRSRRRAGTPHSTACPLRAAALRPSRRLSRRSCRVSLGRVPVAASARQQSAP
mmetsp:Transcript_5846/g.9644  ORF Transcript_5846/g.9644 Transcript_5846/m.9644 type:complete len:285 (-) Transcript_5846:82-936(-)